MEGGTDIQDQFRQVAFRELGALRRGEGLTEDALQSAVTLLGLEVVRRAATARRVEPWQAVGQLVREWLGRSGADAHTKALQATMGVSMIGRSAAARRREYRKQHEIFSSDDSVKYHEDKALEMLAGWFLEQSKTLPLAKWEEWSVFDYHPPGQLRCIANWDRYRLGPDRRPILSEVERLFVGRRDGITRVTFVGRYSGGNDVLIPEVVQGGTYDGVIVDQTVDGYRRYGVLLDRPINEEEEFRLRWQFRYDHEKSIADPLPVIANVFEIQPCLSRIDVIFDPRAIPMRVYSAVAPSGSWPRRGDEPVQMKLEKDHTGSALWRTVPKEYAAGIYWEWD